MTKQKTIKKKYADDTFTNKSKIGIPVDWSKCPVPESRLKMYQENMPAYRCCPFTADPFSFVDKSECIYCLITDCRWRQEEAS